MTAGLPGFVPVAVDVRRPLPLTIPVRVRAGTFRLLLVATPTDLTTLLAADLATPWFSGDSRTRPRQPTAAHLADALGAPAAALPAATRPWLVVASAPRVHWSRPLVLGTPQRVVDVDGGGHLFDVAVTGCDLRVASLVRTADVGAVLRVAVRDPQEPAPTPAPPPVPGGAA